MMNYISKSKNGNTTVRNPNESCEEESVFLTQQRRCKGWEAGCCWTKYVRQW